MVSSGASSTPFGELFAPNEVVREIGARPHPVYVVRHAVAGGGQPQLAAAERYEGAVRAGDAGGEQLYRDARRLAALASPNLARVREVVRRGDDLVVFSELVEGEKLQELWQSGKLPLEIAVRILIDALSGAGAIHNVRDVRQEPMKLAHGEISPATIVLGLDGVARLLHAIARRVPHAAPEAASFGHLAPEVLSHEPYDARADIFSAGVLLWEALSGRRLFPDAQPATAPEIVRRIRGGEISAPSLPDKAAWAKGLVPVVARALAAAPDDRWPTAAMMTAEIRRVAGLKLAPASTAAAFARSGIGERVRARRAFLDGTPPSVSFPEQKDSLDGSPPSVSLSERMPAGQALELPVVIVPPKVAEPSGSSLVAPPIPTDGAETAEVAKATEATAVTEAHKAPEVQLPQPAAPVSGPAHFAAAIDLRQPSPAPPPIEETFAGSSSEEPEEIVVRRAGRRTAVVLGGVAALGLVIFALAAVRTATRNEMTPAANPPSVANAQTPAPSISPALPPTAALQPADSAATSASIPAEMGSARTPSVAGPQAPAGRPVVRTLAPVPPAAPVARPRRKPKFDPSSL